MIKRILRAGVGMIFFVVFLVFLLMGTLKFRVLAASFWKTALNKAGVYQQLQDQVAKVRLELEGNVKKQAGGRTLPPEMVKALAPLLSLDKVLTQERFKELVETNIDRLFGYLDGKSQKLELYLPIREWNLPVGLLGQPALIGFNAQTPIEKVLPILGVKPEQTKSIMDGLGQVRTIVGYLPMALAGLIFLTIVIAVGHYLLGAGQIDRLGGTAWLIMISGLITKLIGVGAGKVFELFAANAKPPLPVWGVALGRSLVDQFFNWGEAIGLVLGVIGLVIIVLVFFLTKRVRLKK